MKKTISDYLKVFSKDELSILVKESKSISDFARKIGATKINGSTYRIIEKYFKKYDINYTELALRGKMSGIKEKRGKQEPIPLDKVMTEHSTYNRRCLKKRLIDNGLLKNKCAICGLSPEWNGKPLILRLDHINGVNDDNRLHNLRLVCPNCDSQLDTFCGKNINK